jgi:hypothetical protein
MYVYTHNHRQFQEEYLVIDRGYETLCWISQRSQSQDGYAMATVKGRRVAHHKAMYESIYGLVPKGFVLDHRCNQRACVNPAHLETVTTATNNRRGKRAKLTAEKVREIRELYPAGLHSHASLAIDYGVTKGTIRAVLIRKTWRDI